MSEYAKKQMYDVTYTIGRKPVTFAIPAATEVEAKQIGWGRAAALRGTRGFQGAQLRCRSVELAHQEQEGAQQ